MPSKCLTQWDRDFKSFIQYSNRVWTSRYPKFRNNYQGDKIIGYQIAQDYVQIPHQYQILQNISKLTPEMIQGLNAFVIKAALGHKGNKVLCFAKKGVNSQNKALYVNNLGDKSTSEMTVNEVVKYAKNYISRKERNTKQSKIIIEEYLGDPNKGIPIDWKVYVTKGIVRMINLQLRTPQGKFIVCYDRNWQRIPLHQFLVYPEEQEYSDLPDTIKIEMPSKSVLQSLLMTAEKLARVHQCPFCRYDFYCEKGQIYLGEITPVCGGVKNNPITVHSLKFLFPMEIRNNYVKMKF